MLHCSEQIKEHPMHVQCVHFLCVEKAGFILYYIIDIVESTSRMSLDSLVA